MFSWIPEPNLSNESVHKNANSEKSIPKPVTNKTIKISFHIHFPLTKIICHRNFGNEFAFTHSKENSTRHFVTESLTTFVCHIIFADVFTRTMKIWHLYLNAKVLQHL